MGVFAVMVRMLGILFLILAALVGCKENRIGSKVGNSADCSRLDKLSEREIRKCACEDIERYLDDAMNLADKASRSVRMVRSEEAEQFADLKAKFEDSAIFLRLPDDLRDYVLSYGEAWLDCRRRDSHERCSQAYGIRSSLIAMCGQWKRE